MPPGGGVVGRMRLLSAMCALVAAVIVVWQTNPITPGRRRLRGAAVHVVAHQRGVQQHQVPVIETTDPRPFDPCEDIPIDVINGLGLGFTPAGARGRPALPLRRGQLSDGRRGVRVANLRADAARRRVEMDIAGHRAAQYWILKPSDRNNRFWFSCMIAFDTSYGVLQQSLFYAPVYSADDVDCMQTNLQRAQQLVPFYKF